LLHINEVCKFSVEFEYCKPCHQHAENVTIIYIYIRTRNYGNIIKKLNTTVTNKWHVKMADFTLVFM